MRVWIIAGSSSGVGKTSLAEKLTDILPHSIYVKIGHGKTQNIKAANYFTDIEKALKFIEHQKEIFDNCIVESTRLVGQIKADIVIYLDSPDLDPRPDSDFLKKNADIIIGKSSNVSEWRSKLGALELPSGVLKKIMRAFESQDEFLSGGHLVLKSKIWFTRDGETVFGEGLARLLRSIDKCGTLTGAAKFEGLSYRHAWGDLKKAEERLGFKLVERSPGGKSGGSAILTGKARKLLEGYEQFKHRINRENQKWFEKIMTEIIRETESE
jgi:molybdate transport system regulatory protein